MGEKAVMNSVGNAGHSWPLGATVVDGGLNFSVFSRSATGVELLLFDREDDARPARMMRLDPAANRTVHSTGTCACRASGRGSSMATALRDRPDPANGMRFDPAKVLLDPYGRGVVVPKNYSRDAARLKGDNAATPIKSVVTDPRTYNWEGDAPLKTPSFPNDRL